MKIKLTVFVILLLLSALIELADMAVVSANKNKLLKYKDRSFFSFAVYVKNHVTDVVLALLMVDCLLHSLMNTLGTLIIGKFFSGQKLLAIASLLLTVITVAVSMVVKIIAFNMPEVITFYGAVPLYYITNIFTPISRTFEFIARKFIDKKGDVSEFENIKKEILGILDNKSPQDITASVIKNVFYVRELTIDKIMIPRQEYGSICYGSWDKMEESVLNYQDKEVLVVWSRNEDNIIGTINVIDFMSSSLQGRKNINCILCPPTYMPECVTVQHAWQYFRKTSNKLAMVVDEHGTVVGIITKDKIYEEILGDDSLNDEDKILQKTTTGYVIDGSYSIRVFNKKTGWNLDENGATVAGLIMNYAKRIPQENAMGIIDNYCFKVLKVRKGRILLVHIESLIN